MAVIGSAAFGCVVGWAACFATGWRPSVLLARLLWLVVLAVFLVFGTSHHPLLLIAAVLFGALGHRAFVLILQEQRGVGPGTRG